MEKWRKKKSNAQFQPILKRHKVHVHGWKFICFAYCFIDLVRTDNLTYLYLPDKNFQVKPYEVSPLHVAARQNSADLCRLLINHGAKVNIKDSKQKTPLHYAARRGALAAIEVQRPRKFVL